MKHPSLDLGPFQMPDTVSVPFNSAVHTLEGLPDIVKLVLQVGLLLFTIYSIARTGKYVADRKARGMIWFVGLFICIAAIVGNTAVFSVGKVLGYGLHIAIVSFLAQPVLFQWVLAMLVFAGLVTGASFFSLLRRRAA